MERHDHAPLDAHSSGEVRFGAAVYGSFLVAWQDSRTGGGDVRAGGVDALGTLLDGTGFPIAVKSNAEVAPALTAVPTGPGRFAAAYQKERVVLTRHG